MATAVVAGHKMALAKTMAAAGENNFGDGGGIAAAFKARLGGGDGCGRGSTQGEPCGGGGGDGKQIVFHCLLRQYLRRTWCPILNFTAYFLENRFSQRKPSPNYFKFTTDVSKMI